MPDIDPTDVLPVNNLPAPSAPWGRAMEKRLRALEKAVVFGDQDIQGQNRTTAAQLASISEQLNRLAESTYVHVWEYVTGLPEEVSPPPWAAWGLVTGAMTLLPWDVEPSPSWNLTVKLSTRKAGDSSATQILDWYASDSNPDQMAQISTAVLDVRDMSPVVTNMTPSGVGSPPWSGFHIAFIIQWVSDSSPSPLTLEEE